MSYKNALILSASLIATSFIAVPQTAFAQDDGTYQIDEIVVSARKREESLQDVPIAVTALDAAAIENLHTSTITGIDRLVPNVDLGDNPFAGLGLVAVIRGVGFSDPEKSFEPVVGLSIDGIFLSSNTGAAFDVFDLEKVEVLRGPQGTLFGRNTVGGVINATRTRPTGEAGLKLGTRLTNHSGEEFLAVANLPQFEDSISAKIYGFSKKHDQFAVNTVTGEKDPQKDLLAFGGALLFEPNDDVEALISVDYFDDDSFGPPVYNLSVPGADLLCTLPSFVLPTIPNGAGCASGSIDVAEASDFDEFTSGTPFITTIDGWSVTSNIEYDINDNLTFTSLTGYRETDDQQLQNAVGGPNVFSASIPTPGGPVFLLGAEQFPLLHQNRVQEADQFSQEFRLSGNVNENLDFVAGLYYLDSDYTLTGGLFPDGVFGNSRAFNTPTPDVTTAAQQAEAYAVFIDGTYQITDSLSFSGGFRFSYEEKDFQTEFVFRGPLDTDGDNIPDTPNPLNGQSVDVSDDWSSPTWRAILQYDLNDDLMLYGGYSRGFRSGGFNGRGGSVATASQSYDQETVDNFEIGARAEFFDNRLRINPTGFWGFYNDKQEENLARVPGGGPTEIETFVENASEVEIKGVELEVLGRITPEITVRGAFGYVDAEFDEFLVQDLSDVTGVSFIDVSDSRNLRSGPDETASVGINYNNLFFDGSIGLNLDASYNYQSRITTSAAQDPLGLGRDSVAGNSGFDFSATVSTQREGANVSLTGFINDAFDDAPGRLGTSIVIPGIFTFAVGSPTRIYGLEATVEF